MKRLIEMSRKGQASFEFFAALGSAIVFFILIAAFVNINIQEKKSVTYQEELKTLGKDIQHKIFVASNMHDGFMMNITLPQKVNGKNYDLYLLSNNLYLKQQDLEYIFVLPEVTDNLSIADRIITITKTSEEIKLS